MKADALMVGDWVLYNPNVFIEDEYEPPKDCYPTKISCGEDIDLAIEDCYSPIPLTAEILEKNGFWSQHNVGYVMEEHENEIIYDPLDHKLRILKNREQILNLECFGDMCVHELQHALRLCGVDKEIEL